MDTQEKRGNCQDIFALSQFTYDSEQDIYTCPAGETLTRCKHKKQRQAYEYACPSSVCRVCAIRQQCTKAKNGAARTIKRHYDQESIDIARQHSHSKAAKRDRVRRKLLMEGSFGMQPYSMVLSEPDGEGYGGNRFKTILLPRSKIFASWCAIHIAI